jgi:hypothetical protein
MLTVTGREHLMTRQWADAFEGVIVRHPNRSVQLMLKLDDERTPNLTFSLDANPSSDSDEVITPFNIVNVRLSFFPGVALARMWLAAAWGCFLQHEALELVTVGDFKTRVLDPHKHRHWLDHMFHRGFPFTLTPETLEIALATAIPLDDARAIIAAEVTSGVPTA